MECYNFKMKDRIKEGMHKQQERFEKYDDMAIGKKWVEVANVEPEVHTATSKGLDIVIKKERASSTKVQYYVYLPSNLDEPIAHMWCNMPMGGRVQVTGANVRDDFDGEDYRQKGIGTAVYDVIEQDVRAAGGEGVEPHWGSMSEEAIAFWEKRRPEYAGKIALLNSRDMSIAASGLFD